MGDREARFCLRCGGTLEPDGQQGDRHPDCLNALALEPPRFCGNCGRKLRVQVVPDGFRAYCATHGDVDFPTL